MESKMEKNKEEDKKGFTWPVYPRDIPEVKYEVRVLPLQKEVKEVCKVLCQSYTNLKAEWDKVATSYSKYYRSLKDQLNNYGVTKDSVAVQGGAVGGAMLLGYLLARKKAMWRRLVYPLMGGAAVGGAFYLSYDKNRQWVSNGLKNQLKDVWPRKKQ